jgi:hypothetical protein
MLRVRAAGVSPCEAVDPPPTSRPAGWSMKNTHSALGSRRITSMAWCWMSIGSPDSFVPVMRHCERHSAKSPFTVV